MKLFVCATVVLALIAAFCIFGGMACSAIIDDLLALLDTAAAESDVIPPNAAEVSSALLSRWEARYFWISMFLPHHHLDDVKEHMVSLDGYAQTDEYAEWLEAHRQLHQALTHIRGLLKADADNIL